jgi:polyhydroxyalkanoate synthase
MHTLSTGIRWWFESMDQARRRRGVAMDSLGYGPVESPFRTVLSVPGMRLRHYGGPSSGPVALIVPAPIKRHYIWDLAPECSVVRHALQSGLQVWLIEWTQPEGEENHFGLDKYANELIDRCVDTIRAELGQVPVSLFSHSLGGVFAAIYAALRPKRIASVVLVEAPLHFADASGSFGPLVTLGPSADKVTQWFSPVPGSVLNLASMIASPATFGAEPYADLVASMGSSKCLRMHMLVERWTLDEAPMSAALFEQVVEQLYREDCFMRGTLAVNGRQIGPGDVVSPLLAVYDPRSVIIPPPSIIDFHRATASPVKHLLAYPGDTGVALAHVGALIGENAHRLLWPEIFSWVKEHAGRRH